MERSDIRYARVGDDHVAWRQYTVDRGTSDGPGHTVVMVNGALFPMDSLPTDPMGHRLLEGLAGLGRLVVFDRRGIALSDDLPPDGDDSGVRVRRWVEDLEAVVEAAGSDRHVLFSWHPTGIARCYAGAHPARVSHLVLLNPDGTLGPADAAWGELASSGVADVQDGEDEEATLAVLAAIFPERWRDPAFRSWFDAAGRAGASPRQARRLSPGFVGGRAETAVTDRDIVTPTLVLTRSNGVLRGAGQPLDWSGRVAAEIAGSEHRELPDGAMWAVGAGVDDIVAEITRFVTGAVRLPPPTRELRAVLFTDLVASTEQAAAEGDQRWRARLDRHDEISATAVDRCGGETVKSTGDGVLALLPSVTAALRAARDIRRELEGEGLAVRAGVHVGEVDRRGDDVSGIAVHVGARIMAEAEGGAITLSSTAAAVLDSTERETLVDLGERALKGLEGLAEPGTWRLYSTT